jgi:hypothetical protein
MFSLMVNINYTGQVEVYRLIVMVNAYLSYVNYEILLLGGHWVLLVKLKLNTMGICTWVLDEIMAM